MNANYDDFKCVDDLVNSGARGEALSSLYSALGQGLFETQIRLDRRGSLRENRLHFQHEPETSEIGSLSMPGNH
jgi:hypothetical protein